MGKGAWHPTWPSEFSALDPCGGRRADGIGSPLVPMRRLWHECEPPE